VSGSRLALLLKGLLLVGLVGGLTAFVVADKTVTLEIDGEAASVRTYAATVGDLLADQGVALSGHDVVAPSPDTPLDEGQLVAVAYGRPMTLWIDGDKTQAWTTARTVGEAVQAIGVRAEGAWFSASRSARLPREGFDLAIRLPKAVAVVADGARRDLVTTAPSVADVLAQAGVVLGASDEVSSDLRSAPTAGLVVTVTRVAAGQEVIQVPVPFAEVRQDDATLLVGSTKVAREGVAGVAVETYATALRDGAVVSRTLVSRVVATAPVDRLVLVGTKPKPAPAPRPAAPAPANVGGGIPASVQALNWAALARCESGGNPQAVGGGGKYFGLYQFTLSAWASVGGSGNPIDASASEQTYRAQLLYMARGASPWGTCGSRLFS
jgi:resuscitation-promoting factor RpfB